MTKEALLKELADAVSGLAPEKAKAVAEKALKEKLDPVVAINEGLVVGMGIVGDMYADRKMYLPQVLVAAHAMYEGLDVLLPAIPKGELKDAKTAACGVVQGDVHDIGKNIVKTMLTASGYLVHDYGKDVAPAEIADGSKNEKTQIICISTLMTPTMDTMAKTVALLRENGYRGSCTVTIGGPPTSTAFAQEIGADHRDESAQDCVKWLKSMHKGGA